LYFFKLISDNSYYSKPHILIVKDFDSSEAISYGYVDFREMEMEELFSSVGIKCTIRSVIKNEDTGEEQVLQEGVSVTPSRESILFDDHTRNYIITKFKEVQEEASQLVSDKLKEKDFLAWIDKASNALSNSGSDPILNRLSKIINKEEINPIFPGTKIKYLSNPNAMFPGFYIKEVFLANEYKNGRYESRLKREFANTGWINPTLIFFKDADTDREKDHYLQSYASSLGYSKFYLVEEMAEDLYIGSPKLNKDRSLFSEEELDAIEEKHKKSRLDAKAEIWQLYSSSKHFKNYSEVDIPEDWLKTFRDKNKEEEDTVEHVKIKALSPKEQRALAAEQRAESIEIETETLGAIPAEYAGLNKRELKALAAANGLELRKEDNKLVPYRNGQRVRDERTQEDIDPTVAYKSFFEVEKKMTVAGEPPADPKKGRGGGDEPPKGGKVTTKRSEIEKAWRESNPDKNIMGQEYASHFASKMKEIKESGQTVEMD